MPKKTSWEPSSTEINKNLCQGYWKPIKMGLGFLY